MITQIRRGISHDKQVHRLVVLKERDELWKCLFRVVWQKDLGIWALQIDWEDLNCFKIWAKRVSLRLADYALFFNADATIHHDCHASPFKILFILDDLDIQLVRSSIL